MPQPGHVAMHWSLARPIGHFGSGSPASGRSLMRQFAPNSFWQLSQVRYHLRMVRRSQPWHLPPRGFHHHTMVAGGGGAQYSG